MSAIVMSVAGASTAVIGATALAVGAVATVGSAVEARKAGKAQKKAIEVQQRQADIQAKRDAIAAVRQTRLAKGSVAQRAANAGVGMSSGNIATQGALQSNLASELGTQQQIRQLSERGSIFNQQVVDAQSNAAIWGAIGSMSSSVFSDTGGMKKLVGGK